MTYKSLLVWPILLAILAFKTPASSGETAYSQVPIEDNCKDAYYFGMQTYQEGLESNSLGPNLFSEKMNEVSNECFYEYSSGLFDAQGMMLQTVISEYVLDLDEAPFIANGNEKIEATLKSESYKYNMARLKKMGLDIAMLDKFSIGGELNEQTLKSIYSNFQGVVRKTNRPVVVGRYIFYAADRPPHTHLDYERSEDGRIIYDQNGKVNHIEGSYQKTLGFLYEELYSTVEEFLQWEAPLFWGKDSLTVHLLKGAARNLQSLDDPGSKALIEWRRLYRLPMRLIKGEAPPEKIFAFDFDYRNQPDPLKSDRHLKIENTGKFVNLIIDGIKELKPSDMTPFYQIDNAFRNRLSAILERDIESSTGIAASLVMLPALPLCAEIGAFFLVQAGVSSLTASMVAYASSVVAIGGYTVYGVYSYFDELKSNGESYDFDGFMEHMLGALTASVPLAALLPMAVGMSAFSVKAVYADGMKLWGVLSSQATWGTLRSMGVGGTIRAIPKVALKGIKAWGTSWWTKKKIKTQFLTKLASSIAFEITFREMMGGDQKFFKEEGINRVAVYSIFMGMFSSIIGTPIQMMDSPIFRFVMWRAIDFTSGPFASLIADDGTVDWNKIEFDMLYGMTIGAAIGELERYVTLDLILDRNEKKQFFKKASNGKRAGYAFMFGILLKFVKYPMRIKLIDSYLANPDGGMTVFKDFFVESFNVDYDVLGEELAEESLEMWLHDSTLVEWLKNESFESPYETSEAALDIAI